VSGHTTLEYDPKAQTALRTCPDCKQVVPHRKVLVKGSIFTTLWRPMRHCRRCGFVNEAAQEILRIRKNWERYYANVRRHLEADATIVRRGNA
jgi:C4-type Zn-finger protein